MGSAPAWLSLLIMLVIGFLLGGACGVLWSTRRQRKHPPPADEEQPPQAPQWTTSINAKTHAAPYTACTKQPIEATGPLGRSIALSGGSTFLVQCC